MTNTPDTKLYWRPDFANVVERHRAWFEGQRTYLVTIIPDSWPSFDWDLHIDIPTPRPLAEFDFFDDRQLEEHLSFRLAQFESFWQTKAEWGLDDDFIPVFEPRIGWAEIVAPSVEGAQVHFYAQTSAMEPVVADYETFDWGRIRYSPDSPWGVIVTKINQWSAARAHGRFLLNPKCQDANPSDYAKACRGDDFFLDLVLNPDGVHKLMDVCTRAVVDFIQHQRSVVGGDTLGGYGTTWQGGFWTPGTALGHVGDNVSDLVSGEMFETFLAPYLRRFLSHFDGFVFARDVTTKQIWGALRGLGNILAFAPRKMGGTDVTSEDIRTIAEATEGLPLIIEAFDAEQFLQFRQAVEETGLRAFFVVHCQNVEEGRRVLDDVRQME